MIPTVMPVPNISTPPSAVTLSFSPSDFSQLEAFASLHGETVTDFVQRAALEAASITSTKKGEQSKPSDPDALWLTEGFADAREEAEVEVDLFAPMEAKAKPQSVKPSPKRGLAGEPSTLAKGHGPVREIRRALGRERVHGLGWTREQLAFVLKLSVVGVRKMEHLGKTPAQSMEARKKLLELAKLIPEPGAEICSYIEREDAALS
jgi:hypothetical protein